jgi:hypothetical protein
VTCPSTGITGRCVVRLIWGDVSLEALKSSSGRGVYVAGRGSPERRSHPWKNE